MRKKRALKGIITALILQIVSIICGFIVPKLIISTYGSNVNGLISSITQFLAYITLLEAGIGPVVKSSLYKPIAKKNEKEILEILSSSDKFFKKISYIFIIYIIFLIIIYPNIVINDFDIIFTVSLIVIISFSTFSEYYFGMTYRLYLQANQQSYVINYIQIFTLILNTILIIILVNSKCSVQIMKLFSTLVFLLRPLLQNIYVKKKYNLNLKNYKSNYQLKNKKDALAQHVAYIINTNTDVTVLTLFTNILEVSVYSVYSIVTKGLKSIVLSISDSISPTFGDMLAKGEIENLNKKFSIYETLYIIIITILYSSAICLIIPFIEVYTKGINDVNYIRPIFSILLIISELIYCIRIPYNSLILTAGHFKETKTGAWREAIINIIISIILVNILGLVGVIIGTLVATIIRTIEIYMYANKKILKRNLKESVMKILLSFISIILIYFIYNQIDINVSISYLGWIIRGIITVIISIFIVILVNIFNLKKIGGFYVKKNH